MARSLFDATGQRQILPAITVPTLDVWGGDHLLPAHDAYAAVALLPHGRRAMIRDCGHLPRIVRPGQRPAPRARRRSMMPVP